MNHLKNIFQIKLKIANDKQEKKKINSMKKIESMEKVLDIWRRNINRK